MPVKVILETCRLTPNEKIIACALAKSAGAAFVKTSTGMGSHGATVEDVARVGDELTVMVVNIDSDGRIRLSRQAVLEGWTAEEAMEHDRGAARRRPSGPGGDRGGERGRGPRRASHPGGGGRGGGERRR